MARGLLLAGLVAIVTATATPSLVNHRLELVATAEAKEPKKSIDRVAIGIIDGFDGDSAYANLQNGNYDQVLTDYQDDADVLRGYDLDSLQGERRRLTSILFDNVGHALKNKGSYNDALIYFNVSITIIPSASSHGGKGFCYGKLKKWEDALREYVLSRDLCDNQECIENTTIYIQKIEKLLNR